MKKPVLVLLAVLSLVSFAPSMAQTPLVAAPAANPAVAPAPDSVTQFLATLSDVPAQTFTDQVPAPSFLASCTSDAECPAGQLCCNVCGNPPDVALTTCRACVKPLRGRCPLIV